MNRRLFLDVVVLETSVVIKLLSTEDEALLIRWDALLVLDLRLQILNRVFGFNFKSDGLASQSLHEDLHTTPESENQVQS